MALQVIIVATGSEVEIAYEAAKVLAAEGVGVRVVNLASWELFGQQDEAYRAEVLPLGRAEAGHRSRRPDGMGTMGWQRSQAQRYHGHPALWCERAVPACL